MIGFSIESARGAQVVHLYGGFDDVEASEMLAAQLAEVELQDPMVIDLTDIQEPDAPEVQAFVLRLASWCPKRPTVLVHHDMPTRRLLRARSGGVMVAPDLERALADGLHLVNQHD